MVQVRSGPCHFSGSQAAAVAAELRTSREEDPVPGESGPGGGAGAPGEYGELLPHKAGPPESAGEDEGRKGTEGEGWRWVGAGGREGGGGRGV